LSNSGDVESSSGVDRCASPVRSAPNKRKLDTNSTQAGHRDRSIRQRKDRPTVHVTKHKHTVHTKHKGATQPTQHTDRLHNWSGFTARRWKWKLYRLIYFKIKHSTTVLTLGHFTDPHPLYCQWFAERRVSLNKNSHHHAYLCMYVLLRVYFCLCVCLCLYVCL
jgi:hypothetical protein